MRIGALPFTYQTRSSSSVAIVACVAALFGAVSAGSLLNRPEKIAAARTMRSATRHANLTVLGVAPKGERRSRRGFNIVLGPSIVALIGNGECWPTRCESSYGESRFQSKSNGAEGNDACDRDHIKAQHDEQRHRDGVHQPASRKR